MSESQDGNRYYPSDDDLRFPPLTEAEELDLARRIKTDPAARETFITRHLLYTLKLGRRFSGGRLPVDETTSAANEALMLAVDRFDPEKGYRFRSFLLPYVRAAIARCWRARAQVNFKHGPPPQEVSLDAAPPPVTPSQLVENLSLEQDDHDGFLRGVLSEVTGDFCPRDQTILKLRYTDGYNLAQIAKKLSLSRERVRQIHGELVRLLKARLEKRGIRKSQ